MSVWTENERGPDCFCGKPTVVKIEGLLQPSLLCVFHRKEEGAMFALPDARPEWWPTPTEDDKEPVPPDGATLTAYMNTAVRIEEDE